MRLKRVKWENNLQQHRKTFKRLYATKPTTKQTDGATFPTINRVFNVNLHDGTFVSTVVGDGGVLVEVANTAVVTVSPVPRTTTERAVRIAVSARVVAYTSSDAIAVRVRAIIFVAAVQGRRNIAGRTEKIKMCARMNTNNAQKRNLTCDDKNKHKSCDP